MRVVLGLVVAAAVIGGGWWWTQRQIAPPPPSLAFFVVGDNHGAQPVYKELLTDAKAAGAAFAVNLADLTEHGSAEEFREVLALEAEVGLPVYHVLGSHDLKADPSRATWRELVGEPFFSFDQGPNHFVLLDNAERAVGFPEDELTWLDHNLTRNDQPFTFLFYHRPFGLPLEGLFGGDETPASRQTNERFRQTIRRAQPTMIFSAHVHTYLPYELEGVPAYVTGGGGDPAQTLLGGARSSFFHGLLVRVQGRETEVKVLRLRE